MRVIDYIRDLDRSNNLIPLIQAEIINSKYPAWLELYNFYDSRFTVYGDKKEAVKITASKFNCAQRTVYNVINRLHSEIRM